jgi:HPt (histidine-containing phosphotransfer) domain-containing protein
MGSNDLIKEMIQIFVEQVPEFTAGFSDLLLMRDFPALGALAHKAKSSVAIMGMEALAADLKKLELAAKAGNDQESYPLVVQRFNEQVTLTAKELGNFAETLD